MILRRVASALAGVLIATSAVPATARVDVHIGIGVPPPVVEFRSPPPVVLVPGGDIYYVPSVTQYDMYRVGRYWYINQDGYWYRSRSYRGPFRLIEYRALPPRIVVLPRQYRRHPLHPRHPRHPRGPHSHR